MGKSHKKLKRVDVESQHMAEDESDSDGGMGFPSKRMEQQLLDEDVSASGDESLSEDELQEDEDGYETSDTEQDGRQIDEEMDGLEDENEASVAEQNERQIDEEMDELEKQYQNIRSEEQILLKNLKRQKDEDAVKGHAVKNQKVLWDKTLELRFLLQKTFSNTNKLPQEPVRSLFCNSAEDVDQAYSDLVLSSKQTLSSILELQEALLEKNPFILQSLTGNKKEYSKNEDSFNKLKEDNDEEWSQISNMHSRITPFRNSSIDKWHRKTQVISGAVAFKGKMQAFNQNISEQVNGYMRDPSRMIRRMQLRRSSVGVFGEIPELTETENLKEEANALDEYVDGDPELLEDSEFYSQLLKEFLESNLQSSETLYYSLKKLQPKKRKTVDRRASKSRKIRYHVHEKIVNFMAPLPMQLPSMAPKLFENLFGAKKPETKL
ncbi:protein AATF-like isoform X1 [Zingiber officinale]|uniref:protein AATF-like isoform X1 n=1 Tax=Zingiber officinale TaxID=94328 RepID=UPI001C4C9DE4|nr:protein AATF-like isoform X1 [Zingiber officinale]